MNPLRYVETLSNWGRWGADDQLGALNLVDDAKRSAAARLVRTGTAVSCSWDVDDITRLMKRSAEPLLDPDRRANGPRWQSTVEHVAFQFHGATMTHLDAPSHIFWDGAAYNGFPPGKVSTEFGAQALDVTAAASGVFTRGVLLDIPALLGVDWLDPGSAVTPDQLDAAAHRQGVAVGPGDALLVRVGRDRIRVERGADAVAAAPMSGLDADCLPWLAERDVAVLGSDATNDILPFVDLTLPIPVHVVGIRNLGMWLIDNANFDALAAECARQETYEFLYTMQPLRLTGVTGSPVNPVAVF